MLSFRTFQFTTLNSRPGFKHPSFRWLSDRLVQREGRKAMYTPDWPLITESNSGLFVFHFLFQGISTQRSLHVYNNTDECYAYQDEIGTPYCVTILDTTLNNGVVMFRSRNTTLQEFMHVSDILSTVKKHLGLNSSV